MVTDWPSNRTTPSRVWVVKPASATRDGVGSGWERGYVVVAFVVGDDGASDIGVDVGDGDSGRRHQRLGLIDDVPTEDRRPSGAPGQRTDWQREQQGDRRERDSSTHVAQDHVTGEGRRVP